MKKRNFLTSVAVLAAAMTFDAGAALQPSEQSVIKKSLAITSLEITRTQTPFVLERPVLPGTLHAQHRSHSSHSSHVSSRY